MAEKEKQHESKGSPQTFVFDEPLSASEVKPTPTQEENDRAMEGEHVLQKEADGSPEDHSADPDVKTQKRQVTADKPGSYQTRQTTPAPQQQPPKPPSS
jgi:hypothetical protein